MVADRIVRILCPSCRAEVPGAALELSLKLGRCPQCDCVFSLEEPSATRPLTPAEHRAVERQEADGLHLTLPWQTPVAYFIAFFATVWNLIMLYIVGMIIPMVMSAGLEMIIVGLVPMVHVSVGVGLAYYSVALFVNKTDLHLSSSGLHLRHGPLPWRGNRDVPRAEIAQLFVGERIVKHKNSSRKVYDLKIVLEKGTFLTLLPGIDLSTARFLEHRIEKHLGLSDRPVGGEHLG
jgi:hypothetical protein